MREVFEDTRDVKAHYYLDSGGREMDRMEFLEQVHDGQWSYMLYVGGGYVPLRVAVTTNSHRDYHGGGESEAIEAFEEWARDERPEEIGEGPDFEEEVKKAVEAGEEPPVPEYELHIETIPREGGTEPASIAQAFFIDGAGNITLDGEIVGNVLDKNFDFKLTYEDFETLRTWREMHERMAGWVESGKKIRGLVYARRPAGVKEGRVGISLLFEPVGRGKRWGEGAWAHIGSSLEKLADELAEQGYQGEIRKTTIGYEFVIESRDFDGFHWTLLEIPMRAYKLTDYLVQP